MGGRRGQSPARGLAARLVTTTGLGHRRILQDKDAASEVIGFMAGLAGENAVRSLARAVAARPVS